MPKTERWEDWFDAGETLLWQGAPKPGIVHWLRNIGITAFGIPFLCAGLFCAAAGLRFLVKLTLGDLAFGVFLTAFSVPFVVVGGVMVFGPWVADVLVPQRTRYALTNKAGYEATRYWGRKMDVFPIKPETRIELIQHRYGASSVHFHFEEKLDSDGDQSVTKKGFADIADGEKVYRLVRNAQAAKATQDG